MPYYTDEYLAFDHDRAKGPGLILFILFLFAFGIMPVAAYNWAVRLYLFTGLITFILRLRRNRAEFFKELGCAFKSHTTNFWSTLILWPIDVIALALGCKCSFISRYSIHEFDRIFRNNRGIHRDTVRELVEQQIDIGEKEIEQLFEDMVYKARKTTAVVGSGAMITLANYAFAKGTPPRANEEVELQMIIWGDFMHDRQLWLKLKIWYFEFWQQNRWPAGKAAPASYIGGGFKVPLFSKSAIVVNCGPQGSDEGVDSFAFFVNLILGDKDWQIVLANRAQKNFFNKKVPWVIMHIQSIKTPLLEWLRLKVDQAYLLNKLTRLRVGPEFSFPTDSLKYFRLWPSYDFIQEIPDVRLQFQYSF